MIKLFKTSPPLKLFDYDCVTPYRYNISVVYNETNTDKQDKLFILSLQGRLQCDAIRWEQF